MQITPLGGAGEVGASAALLEVAGARILIDAGIRTSSAGRDRPLPSLSLLDGRMPDAMIVTHAHTDHTGALPLVLPYIGGALIHMTTGTLHVLEVLQVDAVRHQKGEETDVEGEVKYDAADVERMIARVVPHRFGERFCPVDGRDDIQVQFIACGHILGAGMLVIDTPEGRILWTGDYSVSPQPTVGGVDLDALRLLAEERPFSLMVSEGTYGSAVHPPREREEAKLIRKLERATERGGRVLIPAFAVGRSQDIGVLIRRAKLEGRLSDVAVYFDGMVRGITTIYQNVAHEIYPAITEPIEILDPELKMFRANASSRARLLAGDVDGPAIVISSSGMLIGGRSVEYARAFVPGKKNALLITGYSDEESPARAVQQLSRGGRIRLGPEGSVRVRCDVKRYGLSAHADFAQVCQVVDAVSPARLAVVHGDPPSLASFARAMREFRGGKRTVVLANGDPFSVARERRRWTPPPVAPPALEALVRSADELRIGLGAHPRAAATEKDVRRVWESVVDQGGDTMFSEHEICRFFLGSRYSPEERDLLSRTLTDHRLYFLTGSATGQRSYRARGREEVIERLLERSNAFQMPVERGDLVLFSDGSSDLHLALVDAPADRSQPMEAIVVQSGRRQVRREWLRARTGINGVRLLSGPRQMAVRWLEDLMREARRIEINMAEIYHEVGGRACERVTVDDVFRLLYPSGHDHPDAALLAVAFALAGAERLFHIQSDGSFRPRTAEDVRARWDAFDAYTFVRGLPPGERVPLEGGVWVSPTGERSLRSFEARTMEGVLVRCNYRRVEVGGKAA